MNLNMVYIFRHWCNVKFRSLKTVDICTLRSDLTHNDLSRSTGQVCHHRSRRLHHRLKHFRNDVTTIAVWFAYQSALLHHRHASLVIDIACLTRHWLRSSKTSATNNKRACRRHSAKRSGQNEGGITQWHQYRRVTAQDAETRCARYCHPLNSRGNR
jgi:hypothetical protein